MSQETSKDLMAEISNPMNFRLALLKGACTNIEYNIEGKRVGCLIFTKCDQMLYAYWVPDDDQLKPMMLGSIRDDVSDVKMTDFSTLMQGVVEWKVLPDLLRQEGLA